MERSSVKCWPDAAFLEALDTSEAIMNLYDPQGPLDRAVAPIMQRIFGYRRRSLCELANQKLPVLRRYRDSLDSSPWGHCARKRLEAYIAFWEAVRENPQVLRRELRRLALSQGMSAPRFDDLYMDACEAAMALRQHRELVARRGLWRVLWRLRLFLLSNPSPRQLAERQIARWTALAGEFDSTDTDIAESIRKHQDFWQKVRDEPEGIEAHIGILRELHGEHFPSELLEFDFGRGRAEQGPRP